jgi:ribonuclease VapC
MIVVDTSALMAIVLDERDADRCDAVLVGAAAVSISAGTLAEALIVSGRRDVAVEMARLVDALGMTVELVTAARARGMAEAYGRWGKGVHPAGLNLGDCFAYALAIERACPLLFIGNDFARTDVIGAL